MTLLHYPYNICCSLASIHSFRLWRRYVWEMSSCNAHSMFALLFHERSLGKLKSESEWNGLKLFASTHNFVRIFCMDRFTNPSLTSGHACHPIVKIMVDSRTFRPVLRSLATGHLGVRPSRPPKHFLSVQAHQLTRSYFSGQSQAC